jgi:glutamine synthetase
LREELKLRNIDVLRFIYADILGIPRSKDVLVSQLDKSAHNGPAFCQGIWVTTVRGDVLDAGNIAADGLQDFVSRFDPETITELPWEPGVAYAIVDAYNPDESENMFSPRMVLKKVIRGYEELGLVPVVGPELEFYIAKATEDGGFQRQHERTGQPYTTGSIVDPDGTFLNLLRNLDRMNIGVFAGNHEFSPAQYEINLWHSEALDAADRTFMFKAGIKDLVNRSGKTAKVGSSISHHTAAFHFKNSILRIICAGQSLQLM